jgi:hypothetical protein
MRFRGQKQNFPYFCPPKINPKFIHIASYTFEAKPTDQADHFKVVFATTK